MMRKHLLDASALLALIQNETGAEIVEAVLDDSEIHVINLLEVMLKLGSKGWPVDEVKEHLASLNLEVLEELGTSQAVAISKLGPEAQRLGLSLGDCVCLGIADWFGATVVTADRKWSKLKNSRIKIVQIRE